MLDYDLDIDGAKDALEDLLNNSPDIIDEQENIEPALIINLDEVNEESQNMARLITERLSGYYFDEDVIKKHPYIPTKIMTEMNNIRRLLKMLSINEKAQDSLIQSIAINAGKGALYMSLTSLQNSMLNIQKQLNDMTATIEEIFRNMQEESEKSFAEKDKEVNTDGSVTVRGSRDFIKELNARLYGKTISKDEVVDTQTGEIIKTDLVNNENTIYSEDEEEIKGEIKAEDMFE